MAQKNLSITITGRHASIENLRWDSVPPLTVITGVNGAGKTQLLEIIADSYDALHTSFHSAPALPTVRARADITGAKFRRGEVFHSYGEWEPLTSAPATEDHIRDAIHELLVTRRHETALIAADLGVDAKKVREITPRQFVRILTPGVLWTYGPARHHSLSALFLAYRFFERDAVEAGESPDHTRARLGEPPWLLMTAILRAAGLPFTINHPPEIRPTKYTTNVKFEFQLRDGMNNAVPMDQLSSGERVLMQTATWRYQAEVAGRYYRLLLLDEPDAHLHPSLTRRFLNVIRDVFVEQRNVRVIMTTHSPSTVALTPEGCLFEMQRTEPRLRAVGRAKAIAGLTDGFVAVQDATRTVLVEGKDDPPFYNLVWQLLIERATSREGGALDPYPAINFIHGQGRQTVQELVAQLRTAGFANFYGVIDRDRGNIPGDGVFVLSRCSIENFLYDPLNVWTCLMRMGIARDFGLYVPSEAQFVREMSETESQAILDSVTRRIEEQFANREPSESDRVSVKYHNGAVLSYPAWCLTRSKASIKTQYARSFIQLSMRNLLESYAELNLVSTDLVQLYKTLQGNSVAGESA